MHSHNKEGGGNGMMRMMILGLLIVVGVLFLGGGKLSGGGYLWSILIGVFVVAHVWMMFGGHGKHGDTNTEEKTDNVSAKDGVADEHKHGGSCH